MEHYLQITQINDFIFCPRSIYYHDIFRNTSSEAIYQQSPQKRGQATHARIDEGIYSSKASILSGCFVYSEHYKLLGRIDIFDREKGLLTERKYSVTAVYEGFRYQLYAQRFALMEMGYEVREMRIHSLKDNRLHPVPLPDEQELIAFERVLDAIRNYSPTMPHDIRPARCRHCIYNPLCELYEGEEEGEEGD